MPAQEAPPHFLYILPNASHSYLTIIFYHSGSVKKRIKFYSDSLFLPGKQIKKITDIDKIRIPRFFIRLHWLRQGLDPLISLQNARQKRNTPAGLLIKPTAYGKSRRFKDAQRLSVLFQRQTSCIQLTIRRIRQSQHFIKFVNINWYLLLRLVADSLQRISFCRQVFRR